MSREWVVYVLRCPDTSRVRYVGWTVDLVNRMAVHRYRATKKIRHTYCEKWVGKLLREGKKPAVEEVERGTGDWAKCEQKWITHFRNLGEPLTNLTDGGEGCLGYVPTAETRERLRSVLKGRRVPESVKEYMRKIMKGRVFSPEWKAKISRTKLARKGTRGATLSEEHKAKIAAGLRGHKRPYKPRGPLPEGVKRKILETKLRRYGRKPPKLPKGQARGERIAAAKLTDENVRKIHSLRAEGMKQSEIALMFGIHSASVSRILSGRQWSHVFEASSAPS